MELGNIGTLPAAGHTAYHFENAHSRPRRLRRWLHQLTSVAGCLGLRNLRISGRTPNPYTYSHWLVPAIAFYHLFLAGSSFTQLSTRSLNSEYITGIGVFANRTDYATLPVLLDCMFIDQGKRCEKVVTDSGYESLSNYRYLDEHQQQAYIKPNNYNTSKTRKYKAQIGRADNMAYYEPGDYFLCKAGRILARIGTTEETAKDGTKRDVANYRCEDCSDCPCRAACCQAKDIDAPKQLAICWEFSKFRKQSLDRIITDEGKLLRVNRSIQSEGTFGQLKNNRNFRRFLTTGNVKVMTELCLLALSQNIVKYIAKRNSNRCSTHLLYPKDTEKS